MRTTLRRSAAGSLNAFGEFRDVATAESKCRAVMIMVYHLNNSRSQSEARLRWITVYNGKKREKTGDILLH